MQPADFILPLRHRKARAENLIRTIRATAGPFRDKHLGDLAIRCTQVLCRKS